MPAAPSPPAPADAEEVAERLLAAGYPAAHLSAQRTQLQRIEALNALRDFRWVLQQQCGCRSSSVGVLLCYCAC